MSKTLKYLIRGGRLSAAKGFIARILNINPIVSIDETGKAVVFDKAFNQKANMEKVMGYIRSLIIPEREYGIILFSMQTIRKLQTGLPEKMEKLTGKKPVSVVNISPVIGANAGIGAAAVAFLYD